MSTSPQTRIFTVLYYKRSNRVHKGRKGVTKLDGLLEITAPPHAKVVLYDASDRSIISSAIMWDVAKKVSQPICLEEDEHIVMPHWEAEVIDEVLSKANMSSGRGSSISKTSSNCSITSGKFNMKPKPIISMKASMSSKLNFYAKGVKRPLLLRKPFSDGISEKVDSTKKSVLKGTNSKVSVQSVESGNFTTNITFGMKENKDNNLESIRKKTRKYETSSVLSSSIPNQNIGPLHVPAHEQTSDTKFHGAIGKLVIPPSIHSKLLPHQRDGISFLWNCLTGNVSSPTLTTSMDDIVNVQKEHLYVCQGAILADEMGLGKTLMTISTIFALHRRYKDQRFIIVCPSSLTTNWEKEFDKWLGKASNPKRVVIKKGGDDARDAIRNFIPIKPRYSEVLIISYDLFRIHSSSLSRAENVYSLIVDEGHRLKSGGSQTLSAICSCSKVVTRLLITGTPVQNNLGEFYNLVNFVNPGIFGDLQSFRALYEHPISLANQKSSSMKDVELARKRSKLLEEVTSRFMLRRLQKDTLHMSLPPRSEILLFCKLSKQQHQMYKELSSQYWNNIDGKSALGLIMKLRLLCCHPATIDEEIQLTPENYSTLVKSSGKLTILEAMLPKIYKNGEKVVIVSNFTTALDVIELLLKCQGFPYVRFDGKTKNCDRQKLVDRFNREQVLNSFVFLLSSKAGGCGINLTGANRLFMFDPDFNPATDLQAIGRIFRQGQRRPSYIYRMFSSGSLEEVIFQRQTMKGGLATAIDTPSSIKSLFSDDELKDCFTLKNESICDTKDKIGVNWDEFDLVQKFIVRNFQDDVLVELISEKHKELNYVHIVTEASFASTNDDQDFKENESKPCYLSSCSSEHEFEG